MFSVPAALQGAPWDLLLPPAASWWRARSLGFVLSSAEQESRHFLAGQCLVYSQFLFLAHLRLPLLIYLSLILVNEASFHIFISHLSLFFLPFFPLFFNGFLHTWFTNFFFSNVNIAKPSPSLSALYPPSCSLTQVGVAGRWA